MSDKDDKIDFKKDSEYERMFDENDEPLFPNLRKKISFGAEDEFGNTEITVEEIGEDVEANPYDVSLCFEWANFDSCITFNIEVVGNVESEGEKQALIFDLIQSYDGYAEMDDGTIINLDRFVQAWVVPGKPGEVDDTNEDKKPSYIKLVH